MRRACTAWTAALALVFAAAAGGCLPNSVTVGLRAGREKLEQVPVMADAGTPGAKVALIDVRGIIADVPTPSLFGDGPNPVDEVVTRLEAAEKDAGVKAVILRINSPGGTVTGSDILYREVVAFRERTKKPVVVSMGEIAASGGYYLSLAGDAVIAQPTTLTGSIGVIIPSINFSEGLNRIGIQARAIKSGPNKDLANPLEPIRESQYAVLQGVVDEFYAEFKGLVVQRRPGLRSENLGEATDGRIVTGQRALELGLVDQLGGVREAFAVAKERADIPNATLVKFVYGGAEWGPRSPYASMGSPEHGPVMMGNGAGGSELNLVQLRLDDATVGRLGSGSAGVFYLWSPALWAE